MADDLATSPRLGCRTCGELVNLSEFVRDETDGPRLVCPGCETVLIGNEVPSGPFPSLSGADAFAHWRARRAKAG